MKINEFICLTLVLFVIGCAKDGKDGINGQSSLVSILDEPKGINCEYGGVKIVSGVDLNTNNVIDSSEIKDVKYVCNYKTIDTIYDKQVRIEFPVPMDGTYSLTGDVNEKQLLNDFNISNYVKADSIALEMFIPRPADDPYMKGVVELYDITNHKVIENSSISINTTGNIWVSTTTNFIKNFPDQKIKLGLKLTSQNNKTYFVYYYATIIIYRK